MQITLPPLRAARHPRIHLSRARETYLHRPDPDEAGSEAWDDYLHNRENPAGETRRAVASRLGLRRVAGRETRNTITHEVLGVAARAGGPRCGLRGAGGIDRSTPVRFSFDGKTVSGFKGDTVASALLANDIKLMGRSFKYHRPRGPLTAGSRSPTRWSRWARGTR
jgi:sarcosine oxidase delta subunit